MLDKTLGLLREITPATIIRDDGECYDPAEIDELGRVLKRLLYSPARLRARLQDLGVSVVPADFYSEIPLVRELQHRTMKDGAQFREGFSPRRLRKMLKKLARYSAEFDPPLKHSEPDRFSWTGGQFSYSDAMAYYCFVRHLRPRTIIEVGAGWSTLVAHAAIQKNGAGRVVCVEPFPQPYLADIPSVTELIAKPVQKVRLDYFNDTLADGDVLFIDSTHTVKHGSDCIYLYLKILPYIRRKIMVHVHDIWLPYAVPVPFMIKRQVYWTEQYLLYAYLLNNPRVRILYGSQYHRKHNLDELTAFMHGRFQAGGRSLWFTQVPGSRISWLVSRLAHGIFTW